MYELPPILTGTEQDQLRAIRDYLVRLAQSLDQSGAGSGGTGSEDLEALRRYDQQLLGKIDRNDKKLREQIEAINQQELALEEIQEYLEVLKGWLPADGSGAALGVNKSRNNTLELKENWTLTLNGPGGVSASLDAAQLTALLALLS